MGLYNTLRTELVCPRCGNRGEMEINMYFGFRNLFTLHLGDTYPWKPRVLPRNGGRPPGGNIDGEGYAECPTCGKDFWLHVIVRSDRILRIDFDNERPPFISD